MISTSAVQFENALSPITSTLSGKVISVSSLCPAKRELGIFFIPSGMMMSVIYELPNTPSPRWFVWQL